MFLFFIILTERSLCEVLQVENKEILMDVIVEGFQSVRLLNA